MAPPMWGGHDRGMTSPTRSIPFADAATAEAHFARLLELETDCWDVHESMASGDPGFVLLQTAQAGLLTPGWTALLAFFAIGTLAKTMAALARQERTLQLQSQPVRLMLTA